jgi:two-component system KDP operon response regulator KdpE
VNGRPTATRLVDIAGRARESCIIADPDVRWQMFLTRTLRSHGMAAESVPGPALLGEACLETEPNCVFIDVDRDEYRSAIAEVRGYCHGYIVGLTQRGQSAPSAVEALDAGADLVMIKPFTREALLAQIKALRRRPHAVVEGETQPPFVSGDFRFDFAGHTAELGGQRLHLSGIQYRLLEALARTPGMVLTHAQLIDKVWGSTLESSSENLRAHIHNLRRLLRDSPPRLIITERDIGYYLRPAEAGDLPG